jgi:hypothetical protein
MVSLVAAGNTYTPCLVVLREKGYHLWIEACGEDCDWLANKDGREFLATYPIRSASG